MFRNSFLPLLDKIPFHVSPLIENGHQMPDVRIKSLLQAQYKRKISLRETLETACKFYPVGSTMKNWRPICVGSQPGSASIPPAHLLFCFPIINLHFEY